VGLSGGNSGRSLESAYFSGHLFSVLGHFGSIFALIGQFRPFLRPDFPVWDTFSNSRYGILAPRKRPCTIAHPRTVFKRANWAPKLAVFIFVDLGLKALVSFGPIGGWYSREV
jgi:hypothetical protein